MKFNFYDEDKIRGKISTIFLNTDKIDCGKSLTALSLHRRCQSIEVLTGIAAKLYRCGNNMSHPGFPEGKQV